MRKLILLLIFLATPASANLILSETHTITASGSGSIGYSYFEITSDGFFDIYTKGPSIDPEIYLFNDDSALDIADFIAKNDDSCPVSFCGSTARNFNALLENISLASGKYVIAVSDAILSFSEVFSGQNTNDLTGDVLVVVAPRQSTQTGVIPEPVTLSIFGIGLMLIGGLLGRRPPYF